ncbi:MAG: hypothetical protein KC897_09570 [Candidatus Omnitrophica bacterium]|nr:hypothetical protein [Candidatus Omnitrophota bacterium]MCB9722196.1 hypothetical protein [Candidatus Omnitrophota bacterium]
MRYSLALSIFLIFLGLNGFACAADQDDRIADMGFISVADGDEEEEVPADFIERRVPQPKVVNFPTDNNTDFRGQDTSIRVSQQPFLRTDIDTVPGYYELGNPIVVGPESEAVVLAPSESEEMRAAAIDQEFMAAAIEVLGDESGDTVTRTSTHDNMVVEASKNGFYTMDEADGVAIVGPHRDMAYNFYSYDRNTRKFYHWRFGQGRENPFGLTAKQQQEVAKATHKDLMRGQQLPEAKWDFKNEDAKRGIPGIEAKLAVTAGYRQDELNFNIAGDWTGRATPNILSELQWTDLQIWEYKARGEIVLKEHYVLDAEAGWGQIWSGENQDSDYAGNDRTSEFSRSNNKSDDGQVWDYSIAAGYRMYFENINDRLLIADNLQLTLLVGYSRHSQHLVIQDGFQTIPLAGPFSGFLPPGVELDSRYRALWDGPWLGFQVDAQQGDRLRGWGRFEYHFPEVESDANWNLREDFNHPVSFSHFANDNAYGIQFDFGGEFRLTPYTSLVANLVYRYWEAGPGLYRVFFSNADPQYAVFNTRLNEINWSSLSLTGGLMTHF